MKWGPTITKTFFQRKKEIITQILTCIHSKSCLSSTQPPSTAWAGFVFSPANHLFSHYKLVLKAYAVTKQFSHLIWFFFPLPIWWHLKENWMKQLFCSVDALGTFVSQCIRELSAIKRLTEQPYYFHLSKGVLAHPSYWTSNAFSEYIQVLH